MQYRTFFNKEHRFNFCYTMFADFEFILKALLLFPKI